MPGPPAEFSDKTIIFIYGPSNIGKTTFTNFLCKNIKSINIDLDVICMDVYKEQSDIVNPVKKNCDINFQLGDLNRILADNSVIINELATKIINNIELIIENNLDINLIVIEGNAIYEMKNLLETVTIYCEQQKIRYWYCHK